MRICDSVNEAWRVVDKAQVGMYITDTVNVSGATKVPCDPLLITEGDFVNVCIGFDIVTRQTKGTVFHQVHLTNEHILLLVAAAEVGPMDDVPEVVHVQGPGLSFASSV
ncbi:hypothetical protein C8R44DRAFT_892691 [Mycena epipterygia]|nr:hypothetical protein C8R44DRAFT_892691 [Mycena epipterygia]